MIVRKAYKIRLYPNDYQEQQLLQILGACRFVYNYFLDKRKKHYLETKKTLSYMLMARDLTKLRHETNWMSGVQAEPLQQSLRRLHSSYMNFFRSKKGFPKFKSKKSIRQSFQKHKEWKIKGNKIQIQKDLVLKFRGDIDQKGKLGTLIVSKVNDKWYASISAQVEIKIPKRHTKAIGIDMGITTLATLSTGQKFPNIRAQQTLQKKLIKTQRELARKMKGSNRREKARIKVARVYEKIRNVRENHTNQVSYDITSKNHALIAVENLNVIGMMRNRKLARVLADASMRDLLRKLEYKQKWTGGEYVKIGRFYPSSKLCNSCGFKKEDMSLSIRNWKCDQCKKTHDRDVNAAKNILTAAYAVRGDFGRVAVR